MATTIDTENAKNIRQAMDVVITITPSGGTTITITNDTLISCVVSLRSDLSIISPTLPESEINIEAYMATDISDTLAAIPDGTPVTYQAGYDSDMSTVRNFYLAEQITWEDNVMTIHAVDAVHLLDEDLPAAMLPYYSGTSTNAGTTLTSIYRFLCYAIGSVGINFTYSATVPDKKGATTTYLAIERANRRDLIARMMNLFHQSYDADYFDGITNFWPTYVDAGIPTLSMDIPSATYTIKEEDCGDVQKQVERKLTGISLERTPISTCRTVTGIVGSAMWAKNEGIVFTYDSDYIRQYALLYERSTNTFSTIYPVYDGMTSGNQGWWGDAEFGDGSLATLSRYLIGNDIEKGTIVGITGTSRAGYELYTQVIPWDSDMSDLWDARISDTSATSVELVLSGDSYDRGDITTTLIGSTGNVVDMSEELFYGTIKTRGKSTSNTEYEAYPTKAFSSLLDRSNITGSFTWKGDPRMQPRDVVNFTRLDGTTETITLENITITHQGGGTSAEITYRKGIC